MFTWSTGKLAVTFYAMSICTFIGTYVHINSVFYSFSTKLLYHLNSNLGWRHFIIYFAANVTS